MRDEIAMLKSKTHKDQITLWVPIEMKARYQQLRNDHGVNVAEEARKTLEAMLDRIEKAVARGA